MKTTVHNGVLDDSDSTDEEIGLEDIAPDPDVAEMSVSNNKPDDSSDSAKESLEDILPIAQPKSWDNRHKF